MYPWTLGLMISQKLHHVFHDSAKCIFRTPKCRKWTHTKVCSLEQWVSRLGKIAFSGLKNEKNLLKLKEVPLNSGLPDSAKFASSCPQNAVNVLTRKYVPLNRLFKESAEIAFSGSKVQKMSSHESRYPWTVGITIPQKSHIKIAKNQKMSSHEARYPKKRGFHEKAKIAFSGLKN